MAFCKYCGSELNEQGVCPVCDVNTATGKVMESAAEPTENTEVSALAETKSEIAAEETETKPEPAEEKIAAVSAAPAQSTVADAGVQNDNAQMTEGVRFIKPWGYVGYNVLFSIPLVGWIFAIIWAFDKKFENRRNLARGWFCGILLSFIISAALSIAFVVYVIISLGSFAAILELFQV